MGDVRKIERSIKTSRQTNSKNPKKGQGFLWVLIVVGVGGLIFIARECASNQPELTPAQAWFISENPIPVMEWEPGKTSSDEEIEPISPKEHVLWKARNNKILTREDRDLLVSMCREGNSQACDFVSEAWTRSKHAESIQPFNSQKIEGVEFVFQGGATLENKAELESAVRDFKQSRQFPGGERIDVSRVYVTKDGKFDRVSVVFAVHKNGENLRSRDFRGFNEIKNLKNKTVYDVIYRLVDAVCQAAYGKKIFFNPEDMPSRTEECDQVDHIHKTSGYGREDD